MLGRKGSSVFDLHLPETNITDCVIVEAQVPVSSWCPFLYT